MKLTPAVFLLFFLLRRDLRSAARAGLSFAACTGAGFALAPHDSLRYWTQIAYQPTRIGGIAYASNQSILGILARLGLGNPARTWLWLALCLLVVALAVTGMRGVLKAGQVTYALLLNAAAGLLISPISWSHHWVWAAPALLTCLSTTNPNRRRPPTFAVLGLLTFAIAPHWLLPSGGGRELHWSWWQQALGDSYALTGLAALPKQRSRNCYPARNAGIRAQRARWQHHTTRNLDRYRPKPVTTLACRPAHNPGGGPCAALTRLGDTSGDGVWPAGEGNPEVTGYQRTRRKAEWPDTRSDRREP